MKNTQITYTEIDGIYYPDLTLPKQTDYPIGKYGRMHLEFLRKHRKGTYTMLLMEGKLNAYLAKLNEEASEMNNCKARSEEIVFREIIYQ